MTLEAAVELLLLRHADAGDPAAWDGPDADRPLSKKGRRQCNRLATFLAASSMKPDVILASPKVRAAETAEAVATVLGLEVRLEPRLAAPLEIEVLAAILADAGRPQRPMLIGHDPDFSDVASELVGAPVMLRKGALIRIDLPAGPLSGGGLIRWLVPPELLAG